MRIEVGEGRMGEDVKYIYNFTGNPFVDAGIAALCAHNRVNDPKKLIYEHLENSARYISTLYLNFQGLEKLYTNNGLLTNPSTRRNREIICRNYLNNLLSLITPASSKGSCAACGAREAATFNKPIYRELYPLSGSGGLLNFFSFFEHGFPICASCAFSLQFVPLYIITSSELIDENQKFTKRSLFLAHSSSMNIMMTLAKDSINHIQQSISLDNRVSYFTPFHISEINECLIKIARHLISKLEVHNENVSIRLYSFLNSGQINFLEYIDLPTDVFAFLEKAYIRRLYRNLDELFNNSNRDIYRKLIQEVNIGYYFLQKKERKIFGRWELFELYLKEVRKMDEKKLEVIKRVGKRLYEYLKINNFKKLKDIEQADKYGEFRMELTRIQRETLIWEIEDETLLFPQDKEGAILWRETQSILLGYIYEQMHKEGIKPMEV